MSPDRLTSCVDLADVQEVFFNDCSDEDIALAKSLIVPEPAIPISTPLSISAENYGRVSRFFIACTDDNTMAYTCQQELFKNQPEENVYTLESDHSPFFSQPRELVVVLLSIESISIESK